MRKRRRGIAGDAGIIGWISISDVLLLCGVTMLVAALAVSSKLDQTSRELAVVKRSGEDARELQETVDRLHRENQRLADAESAAANRVREADERLRAAEARAAAFEKSLADVSKERDAARREMARLLAVNEKFATDEPALKARIASLEDRLARIDESIVMPLKSARLIIKVWCDDLPPGCDLDLFVQDPHDQVCYWAQPRTIWEARETGLLILSEDLRRVRNNTEEIYYSSFVEASGPDHPYLVFCMIRTRSDAPIDVKTRWEVSVDAGDGLKAIGGDVRHVKTPGRVDFADGGYVYSGLTPLAGLLTTPNQGERPRLQPAGELPTFFRGWSAGDPAAGGQPVMKLRDE